MSLPIARAAPVDVRHLRSEHPGYVRVWSWPWENMTRVSASSRGADIHVFFGSAREAGLCKRLLRRLRRRGAFDALAECQQRLGANDRHDDRQANGDAKEAVAGLALLGRKLGG